MFKAYAQKDCMEIHSLAAKIEMNFFRAILVERVQIALMSSEAFSVSVLRDQLAILYTPVNHRVKQALMTRSVE